MLLSIIKIITVILVAATLLSGCEKPDYDKEYDFELGVECTSANIFSSEIRSLLKNRIEEARQDSNKGNDNQIYLELKGYFDDASKDVTSCRFLLVLKDVDSDCDGCLSNLLSDIYKIHAYLEIEHIRNSPWSVEQFLKIQNVLDGKQDTLVIE